MSILKYWLPFNYIYFLPHPLCHKATASKTEQAQVVMVNDKKGNRNFYPRIIFKLKYW